jgi:hypothetical protein
MLLSWIPDAAPLALLDELRIAAATSAVPVLVMSISQRILAAAQASGNVFAVLAEPFELGDLLQGIESAFDRVPFEPRVRARPVKSAESFKQAAEILARAQREMMLAWVRRIRTVEPFAGRQDIALHEFLNMLPRLGNALVHVLSREVPPDVLRRDADVLARIRDHARIRHRQGAGAHGIVREYQELGRVICQPLRREMNAEAMLDVCDDLHGILDEALGLTMREYEQLSGQGGA